MMRAISLHQPWASAVATGAKTCETRSWPTDYRGPLAIHAALRRPLGELIYQMSCWQWQGALAPLVGKPLDLEFRTWPGVNVEHLPFGAIVAVAEVVDCIPTDEITVRELATTYTTEAIFGDLSAGRYAWKLASVRRLREPVPASGRQRFWHLSAEEEAAVLAQLEPAVEEVGHV